MFELKNGAAMAAPATPMPPPLHPVLTNIYVEKLPCAFHWHQGEKWLIHCQPTPFHSQPQNLPFSYSDSTEPIYSHQLKSEAISRMKLAVGFLSGM